jgi:hypothetical protein
MLESRQLLANVFPVTSTLDDGSAGTLRWAITQVDADTTDTASSPDQISFDIAQTDPGFAAGVWTISPHSPLPTVSRPAIIDGYTQAGSQPNTNGPAQADNAILAIRLSGSQQTGNLDGLVLEAAGITIRGLIIDQFTSLQDQGEGIAISQPGGDIIEGNLIGTDNNSTAGIGNLIGIYVGGSSNTIGGTTPAARNVIAGNVGGPGNTSGTGINVAGDDNVIEGNFIGTDVTGLKPLGNGVGVSLNGSSNTVGGTIAAARNVISGNEKTGIIVASVNIGGESPTESVVVEGNYIGTDATGLNALPNRVGVTLDGTHDCTIGGATAGAGNLISGNAAAGVVVTASARFFQASGNLVSGNLIGTDVTGQAPLGNGTAGVVLGQGPPTENLGVVTGNIIGGRVPGAGNVISGNTRGGIEIYGAETTANVVAGNRIGTDSAGSAPLPNLNGVAIYDAASRNTIGGTAAGAMNVISGNLSDGVQVSGTNTSANAVRGNVIGTNADGTAALPNATNGTGAGVELFGGTTGNSIGGTAAGASNLISGNKIGGVQISGTGTTANLVLGNRIGTNRDGSSALPNLYGVTLYASASRNTIGGATASAMNVISGNLADGVGISGTGTSANVIEGNKIGTNAAGTDAIPNASNGTGAGVNLFLGATGNVIGGTTPGERNLISGNNGYGVQIAGVGTSGNRVEGNFIGTRIGGKTALGNVGAGVAIVNGATANTIGGATAKPGSGAGNVISGNTGTTKPFLGEGVLISDVGTSNNRVQGNAIGTDISGTVAVGNNDNGVEIFGAQGNTIGGKIAAVGNLISGNHAAGVRIFGAGADHNAIQANLIGTGIRGKQALPNQAAGVDIFNQPANNTIGGVSTTPGLAPGNLISGNVGRGVKIWAVANNTTNNNLVEGNAIGTDITGETVIRNHLDGVAIINSSANTIGGAGKGAGNLISGNGTSQQAGSGVWVAGSQNNLISGNTIGTDVRGLKALPNVIGGILLDYRADRNTVGGSAPGAGNLISGNGKAGNPGFGIQIMASGNLIQGNAIGTNITGTAALGNLSDGIKLSGRASGEAVGNTIGGITTTPGRGPGNIISGNGGMGIVISTYSPISDINLVQGNLIGTGVRGKAALPNRHGGIEIDNASDNTIGGTAVGAGNVISGNGSGRVGAGVRIAGDSIRNIIRGNKIGTDITGTSALGNAGDGVLLSTASASTIGGTTAAARNIIAFNSSDGVVINRGKMVSVLGNSIFSNHGPGILLQAGANDNIQAPVLTFTPDPGGAGGTIRGTLSGKRFNTYRIEVYLSPATGTPPRAEGKVLVAAFNARTDQNGVVAFTKHFGSVLIPGRLITATATDNYNFGNTSAFSVPVVVRND